MAITAQKQAMVADLKDIFVNAKGVVFTAYTGITVAQDTKLRRKFREAGVEYRVIKNTLPKKLKKKVFSRRLKVQLQWLSRKRMQ